MRESGRQHLSESEQQAIMHPAKKWYKRALKEIERSSIGAACPQCWKPIAITGSNIHGTDKRFCSCGTASSDLPEITKAHGLETITFYRGYTNMENPEP